MVALAVVALGLLVYRGYGPRFATRPVDDLPPAPVAVVDLNAADRTELLQVPGVGPATADAILAYRHDRGGFGSVDELDAVKGIGDKTLTKLREHVKVGSTARGQAPDPPVERLERKPQSVPTGKVTESDRPIAVNSANLEELKRLPGIGPKLAERIISERGKKPFTSADDLRRVNGIGAKTVEKLRPLVRFD